MKHNLNAQAGFSLIEVLVAVLVLAVGLLGMAGLQAVTLQNGQSAYMRSQATILAYDIMDRMRVNRDQAIAGAYDLGMADDPATGTSIPAQELSAWTADMSVTLPGGDGSVDCTTTAGLCTVTVQWDDSRASGGSASQQIIAVARL